MKRGGFAVLLACAVFSTARAVGQSQNTVTESLKEAHSELVGARLMATDTLQRTGTLPPDKIATLDDLIHDALNVWTSCIINETDHLYSSTIPIPEIVDKIIISCVPDREEVAAWIRLAGQARKDEMPEQSLNAFLTKQESWQRDKVRERLLVDRGTH